jgi:hypothetical protein
MRHNLLIIALVLAGARVSAQEEQTFSFPADLTGKRLEALLRPGSQMMDGGKKNAPLPRSAPRWLEAPEAPLPPLRALPPELRLGDVKAKAPPHLTEPPLLAVANPRLPAELLLPEGALVRWPSLPVQQFPPLPILAAPQVDRAPLGDATMEASVALALQTVFLPRTASVPFAPINLPDPFELRRTVELRDPPPEEGVPPLVTFPRLPGR